MTEKKIRIKLLPDEYWWGGVVRHGDAMPYGPDSVWLEDLAPISKTERALVDDECRGRYLDGNQGCPLLVSSKGRYVWSEQWFSFEFKKGTLTITERNGELEQGDGHENLRGAYLAACEKFFPPSGRIPHELSFLAPQYNAWMDMQRWPTQEKVLNYAQAIRDADMPPGILMIDNYWYRNNGHWKWDLEAFPEPRAMIKQLRKQGFLVVLWVSPFVSSDTRQYKSLWEKGFLLRNAEDLPAIQQWWDGYSAAMDLSNPEAFAWYQGELDELVADYGVSGFKFDGGDAYRYQPTDRSFAPRTPYQHCEDFGRLGLKYDIAEYRACWKLGGQHLIQRVRDKGHVWGKGGFADTIPTTLTHGLVGYPYSCPDMVGGGLLGSFTRDNLAFDQELFIRWAQCGTFFPIVQYSMLPSRVLDNAHLELCMDMVRLRLAMGQEILELANHAAKTGEPIMRHMAYVFPDAGMEQVADQYMVGDKYLIAPVMTQGAVTKRIRFPEGKWRGDDDTLVEGPCDTEVDAPLSRLPWYTRVE